MSERGRKRIAHRDLGMTLPELLIAVTVGALITGVLSMSMIVTLRQRDNTEGRLNVSRAEQNVSMWMPADLASAETVDTSPEATPCGSATCDGVFLGDGSNVLMLEWTEVGVGDASCPPEGMSNCTVTRVSYNFYPAPDGELYELRRVECTTTDLINWSCDVTVVLRELPGPPGGADFVPGVAYGAAGCAARLDDPDAPDCTEPTWVIIVSEPLDPCSGLTGDELTACVGNEDPTETIKDANRVVVSINGGGDGDGDGGGVNQISITAGGTARRTITPDSMSGAPTFNEARSRCGGPLTLVIDQSTSIPSTAHARVRDAAIEFARLLRGTPVDIQVVRFADSASVLGDGQSVNPDTGWHEYFEMDEQADWTKLESLLQAMTFGGSTNWEDALYRTFHTADGATPQIVPETVVFFTDGVPTVDRLDYRGGSAPMPTSPEPYDANLWQTYRMNSGTWVNGQVAGEYYQPSFNRAEYIAAKVRAEQAGYVRLVGVGVGGVNNDVMWVEDPGAGYRTVWEHGYGQYQQGSAGFWSNHDFEQATAFQANLDYEQATSGYQANLDYEQATAFQANLDYEQATVFQANLDYERKSGSSWVDTDPATYYTNNTTSNETDGWRIKNGTGTRTWYAITEAAYDSWRSQSSGNFRINGWTDRTPTQYYTGQPAAPTKWRATTTRGWYTITETEYTTYRSQSAANFQVSGWTDRTPTQYYTSQPAAPALWRTNGTRTSWYTVTQTEFSAYAPIAPSNFRATWVDRTPAQYYVGQPTSPGSWRTNGTRTWYSISEADYDAYRAQSPSNFQVSAWTDRTPSAYYTGQPSAPTKWRINSTRAWYQVTEAEYTAYHGSDTSVNWKPAAVWSWVSKAVYDAGVVTNPSGFRDTGSKTSMSVATAPDFEIVASQGSPADHYRQVKTYPSSGPYTGIEAREAFLMSGREVLARLVAGNSTGTPYLVNSDGTDNAEIANMFVIEGNDDAAWSALTPVMQAIALGECGGTLTLATKTSSGASVANPFTYENSNTFLSDGTPVEGFAPTTVTTNAEHRTRGFDYSVPGGTFITTEIRPQASSVLLRYQPIGWECRAGARVLTAAELNEEPIELVVTNPDGTTTTVPSGWNKITVKISANQAVSCVLKVTQVL